MRSINYPTLSVVSALSIASLASGSIAQAREAERGDDRGRGGHEIQPADDRGAGEAELRNGADDPAP